MRHAGLLFVALSGFVSALLLQPRLEEQHAEMFGTPLQASSRESLERGGPPSAVTIVAGLGIFRPLAINFLSMRLATLQ